MHSYSRAVWVGALVAATGIIIQDADRFRSEAAGARQVAGSPVADRAQSPGGAFVIADTWRGRPDVRPPDAWAQAAGIESLPGGRIVVSDGDPDTDDDNHPKQPRVTLLDPREPARVLAGRPHLVRPQHVAADPARNRLYVADFDQNALVVFGLDGAWVASYTGVPGAYGVAVAGDGSVLVTASASGEVHRFAADGSRLSTWVVVPPEGGGGLLAGVDVDAAGNAHVIDGRASVIHVLDGRGRFVEDVDVAVGAKLVDVAAVLENGGPGRRVYWFATAKGLAFMDEATPPTLIEIGPLTAVAVNRADEAVVATTAALVRGVSQVVRWHYSATLVGKGDPEWLGGLLTAIGVLNGPERVSVGADGDVYILDRYPRVQRYSRQGEPLRQMRLTNPLATAAGPDAQLYATDGDRLQARVFAAPDLDGVVRWQAGLFPDLGKDIFAAELAFDTSVPGGRLVALDIIGRSVRRFDLSGQPIGPPVSLSPGPDGSAEMWSDLAVDAAGRAYVLNRTARLVRVVAPDGTLSTLPLKTPARRLAIAPDDTLFALTRDGFVWHYDAGGSVLGAFDARRTDLSIVSRPTDLTVDAKGDIYVADRNTNAITRFTWDASAPSPSPPETDPLCRAFPDKTAAPPTVLLGQGQQVDVQLSVRGSCGTSVIPPPLDVFLIIDRSGSMLKDRRMEIARQAALDFVHEMDLSQSRVGVATFNQLGELGIGLTSEEGRLWRTMNGITPFGGTQIDLGLKVAREAWLASRRPGVRTVFIVLSDGVSDRASALAEAATIKAAGVEIFTIVVDADPTLMREVATDSSYAYNTKDPNFLYGIFDAIVQRITAGRLFRTIDVTDRLPANMRYVENSAVPPVAQYDPATRTLRWTLADVGFAGLDLRYRVEPLEAGDWPTNVAAWADFVDGYGKAGRVDFPVPRVLVIAPTATPTPTLTPTPTPTVTPAPVFIPIAVREKCELTQRYTDVVLVIDTSGSMVGTKLAAAKAAALEFVRLLPFTPDADGRRNQVAIVAFNSAARLITELSSDRARIEAAIIGLTTATGTWINLGLQAAWDEMRSGRRLQGNTPTVILLTDGIHSGEEAPVQLLGDLMCESRIVLFTIGLGSDNEIDIPFLQALACDPAKAFVAPRPEDLTAIYTQIAGAIPCAPESFWGRR